MKEGTHYFSHDYNSRIDSKIKKLIYKLGYEGYGIFWAIIEDLYNNANALHLDYERIAYELRSKCDIVQSVINDFDLFIINDDILSSNSVEKRLEEKRGKSVKASLSAKKRWDNSNINANAMRTHTERNAIKEKKGKEIKEKESIEKENKIDISKSNLFKQPVVPSKDEVWEFFKGAGGTKEMAKSFYEKYEATGWMLNGSPVVNFRALAGRFVANWLKNDSQRNAPVQENKTQTLKKLPTYIQPKYD